MEESLLKFVRKAPRSTQACRKAMLESPADVEEALTRLRDSGAIAFANGQWYVPGSIRRQRAKPPKKAHPRQGKLFE
jgi:hypothetical protein